MLHAAPTPRPGARPSFLVTLFSGASTREIAYSYDDKGEVVVLESSEWDGPVEQPVEQAHFENLAGPHAGSRIKVSGQDYLLLQEAEAVEGVLGAMARGTPPADALHQGLLVARATL